jgi:hypothetical protein
VSALDFPDLDISNPHQILLNNIDKILKINLVLRERNNQNNHPIFMSSWMRASNSTYRLSPDVEYVQPQIYVGGME